MKRKGAALYLLWLCALMGACNFKYTPDVKETAVGFYNCENFFGMKHDPGKNTDDFTPGGSYHYTRRIYEQKLRNIATVIQGMNSGEGPAILGMAEVENSAVLDDLVQQPEITRRHYKYILIPGPDERGINVALLYHPQSFHEISAEAIPVDLTSIDIRS